MRKQTIHLKNGLKFEFEMKKSYDNFILVADMGIVFWKFENNSFLASEVVAIVEEKAPPERVKKEESPF